MEPLFINTYLQVLGESISREKVSPKHKTHEGSAPILLPIPYMATHKQGNKETSNNQRPKKMK